MAKLIQNDTLNILANKAREIAKTEDKLSCAEILEIMSRTQGSVKTTGKYQAKVHNSQGTIIKSGNYDTGEIFAMPTAPTKEGMTFQGWTSTSPLENNYVVVNDSDIKVGSIYVPNDDKTIIQITTTETNAYIALYSFIVDIGGTINWGDGTIEFVDSKTVRGHTYTNIGTYRIEIDGEFLPRSGSSYNDDEIGGSQLPLISSSKAYVEKVYLSTNLTKITKYFLSNETSLTEVFFSNNVERLGFNCFQRCISLQYVAIPIGVNEIRQNAFYGCTNLRQIVLPYGLTEISKYCFSGCESLESIIIPEGVTSIGDYAFRSCESLESIIIPEGVTSIGDKALYIYDYSTNENNRNNLKTLIFPTTLTTIGKEIFYARRIDNFILLANEICTVNESGNLFNGSNSYVVENEDINMNIYVPDSLVNSYKTHEYWGVFNSKIKPLSQYKGVI